MPKLPQVREEYVYLVIIGGITCIAVAAAMILLPARQEAALQANLFSVSFFGQRFPPRPTLQPTNPIFPPRPSPNPSLQPTGTIPPRPSPIEPPNPNSPAPSPSERPVPSGSVSPPVPVPSFIVWSSPPPSSTLTSEISQESVSGSVVPQRRTFLTAFPPRVQLGKPISVFYYLVRAQEPCNPQETGRITMFRTNQAIPLQTQQVPGSVCTTRSGWLGFPASEQGSFNFRYFTSQESTTPVAVSNSVFVWENFNK